MTASSFVFDRIFINIKDERYAQTLLLSLLLYLTTIAYIYFSSWRTTRYFKKLFAQRLTGISKFDYSQESNWSYSSQIGAKSGFHRASTDRSHQA